MAPETVSVVIPCYNGEAFLAEAIASTLEQSCAPTEVLVVDDGSSDASADIARAFGHPVRLIQQDNAGTAVARNNGIRQARGEWIALLDADDLWHPQKLHRQLAKARDGFDMVYTDAENIGLVGSYPRTRMEYMELPEGDIFDQLLLGNFIVLSSVLVRRSVLLDTGLFTTEQIFCEDWPLWMAIAQDRLVGVVREPLTQYRIHGGSKTHKIERAHRFRLQALESARQLPRSQEIAPSHWRRALANVWTVTGGLYETTGQNRQALKSYLHALGAQPLQWQRWKHVLRTMAAPLAGWRTN